MASPEVSDACSAAMDALLGALNDSLRALAASGQSDEANRIAGRAYAALRHEHPTQAQRVNVLMHALARIPNTSQGAEHGNHGAAA